MGKLYARASYLLLISCGLGCTDIDGLAISQIAGQACEYESTTFTAKFSEIIPELTCDQVAISKSLSFGLQLIPGVEVPEAELTDLKNCGGGLILDIRCTDPKGSFFWSTSCSLVEGAPLCRSSMSSDIDFIEAILSSTLGIDLGTFVEKTADVLDAIAACGLSLDEALLLLSEEDSQCLLNQLATIFLNTLCEELGNCT